jgi:putative endonuclease
MYFVYILEGKFLNKTKYYIGCTSCLEKRIKQHNTRHTKSTKFISNWKIMYYEKFEDKNLAFKREWFLKHPIGYLEKLKIIEKYGRVA